MIDFELTDEQRLVRETARDFADREIVPRARDNDRNEHFDTELVQKIADVGFLGAIVPEEYGGRGECGSPNRSRRRSTPASRRTRATGQPPASSRSCCSR